MMLTAPQQSHEQGNDASRIKAALYALGAEGMCIPLGLCEGPPRRGRGSWWREGNGIKVCCPVHGDRTPSCKVSEVSGVILWHCYACHAGGSGVDLVALLNGIDATRDFREALNACARLAGVADCRGAVTSKPPPVRRSLLAVQDEAFNPEVFARIADVILNDPLTALDRHPEPADEREACACGCTDVRRYLENRGILHLALRDGWRSLPVQAGERVELAKHIVAKVGEVAWAASPLVRVRWNRTTNEREAVLGEFMHSHNRVLIPWRTRAGACTMIQRRFLFALDMDCYPHRRLLANPDDPRLPWANVDGYVPPKYSSDGKALAPYGAHRLDQGAVQGWPVAFVEGAVDALSLERVCSIDPDADPRVIPLGLPGTGNRPAEWGEHARGRYALVALDDDVKESAKASTDKARRSLKIDLMAGGALDVGVMLPRFDGQQMHDWNDTLEAWNR